MSILQPKTPKIDAKVLWVVTQLHSGKDRGARLVTEAHLDDLRIQLHSAISAGNGFFSAGDIASAKLRTLNHCHTASPSATKAR